ncbi:MAG: DnaA ATPase domain-containing protein [Gammaproteobacteria bacterium]
MTQLNEYTEIWDKAKQILKQSVPDSHFRMFADIKIAQAQSGRMVLGISDYNNYMAANGFYAKDVAEAIDRVAPNINMSFAYTGENKPIEEDVNLLPDLNFANYISGLANQSAINAAKASLQPFTMGGTRRLDINPLLIYGPCGVGKTHLLHAIGNKALELNPDLKIRYETVPDFFQQMFHAIKTGEVSSFRARFSGLDLLLLDDLHFMNAKKRTQEELSHIYNHLVEKSSGLLAMTCNTNPSSQEQIDANLRARFNRSLKVKVDLPDRDMKKRVLQDKIQKMYLTIPDDCVSSIVDAVSDVRSLHGILAQIRNRLQISSNTIPISQLVSEAVTEQVGSQAVLNADSILELVSKYYNVGVAEILSKRRTRQVAKARQIGMYLLRQLTDKSFPEIGSIMGGRDHSTVMYACRKIGTECDEDTTLAGELRELQENVRIL